MKDHCDCCKPAAGAPQPPVNRPGLKSLTYRLGTHAGFMAAMTQALSGSQYGALRGLTTRDPSDFSIALLDAWATAADVLCFYQERIANEGFLRTAVEARSVAELAWLVGYRPKPGVAASVYLAYTVDPNADVLIQKGRGAQSVPGPGEKTQTFETSEDLEARGEWNALTPRATRPTNLTHDQAKDADALYFAGTATNLKPNDRLLFVFQDKSAPVVGMVATIEPDPNANRTRVTLQVRLGADDFTKRVLRTTQAFLAEEAQYDPKGVAATSLDAVRSAAAAARDPATAADAATVYQALTTAPPSLRAARDAAIAAGELTLQTWLGGVLAALQQLAGWLDPSLVPPASMAATPSPAPPVGANWVGAVNALVGPLTKPPAVPLASPLDLHHDVTQDIGPGSDGYLGLAAELHPGLDEEQLYTALGNLTASAEPGFTVYALRKRAAVFGANAPKRAILEDGQITGYEEWKLVELAGPAGVFSIHGSFAAPEILFARRGAAPPGEPAPAATTPPGPTVETAVQLDGVWASGNVADAPLVLTIGKAKVTVTLSPGDPNAPAVFTLTYTFERGDFGKLSLKAIVDQNQIQVVPSDRDAVIVAGATLGQDFTFTVGGQLRKAETRPTEQPDIVSLDASYDQIVPQGWIVLEKPKSVGPGSPGGKPIDPPVVAMVKSVKEGSRADYGITGKGTQVTLDRPWLVLPPDSNHDGFDTIRNTAVYAQSEPLDLAEEPINPVDEPVQGNTIELDGLVGGLTAGRWLIVSGERIIAGTSGVSASELVMLQAVQQGGVEHPGDATHTTLVLAGPGLAYVYKRDTVTIYSNVVEATQGQTVRTGPTPGEVLGGGDGSQALQTFTLSQAPVTFVPAATPTGSKTTLQVAVNDVYWKETDDLLQAGPTDHVYVAGVNAAGKTTVTFGDGVHGARLPTGAENVKAFYRVGIGLAGNVTAGQISQLADRPLGVKAVVNPIEASGGADPESPDDVRRNAPAGLNAPGRLVSVEDYTNFARAFAGVGKAVAALRPGPDGRYIHLAIAGADGAPIDPDAQLLGDLHDALYTYGDPAVHVQIASPKPQLILLEATVFLQPTQLWEGIEPAARTALENVFAFANRDIGQPAFLAEAVAAMQGVAGVLSIAVNRFQSITQDDIEAGNVPPKGEPGKPPPAAVSAVLSPPPDGVIYLKLAIPATVILTQGKS